MSTRYLILILFLPVLCFSQNINNDKLKTKYDIDFQFNDGIYLNYNQFKNNNPIPFTNLIVPFDIYSSDFLMNFNKLEQISVIDNLGNPKDIEKKSVWGLAWQGVPYINWNKEINRIPIIGSVCHFVATKTTYSTNYYSPYNNPYRYYHTPGTYTTETKELKQYMIDTETGRVIEYTVDNLEIILMRKPALYEEYNSLSKRKKKKQMFIYLRKYNKANPLYFPEY